jgi:hypothetical protein
MNTHNKSKSEKRGFKARFSLLLFYNKKAAGKSLCLQL